jgi:hypothetical protein
MKLKSLLALCVGVLFVFPGDSQTMSAPDSKRTEDVCEVALRYFFAHDGPQGAKAICISTNMPLPLNFIDRFASNNPRVAWSIECTSDQWSRTKYVKTNELAVVIKITGVRWINSKEAEVKGGSVGGDFVRLPITVKIRERDGRWFVEQDKNGGLS